MNIPRTLAAGDSVTWKDKATVDNQRRSLQPPAWTLKYAIRGAVILNKTATQDGSGWSTTISTTDSATLTPGLYYWSAWVENGSEKITVGSGQIQVTPNISAATAGADLRTQLQKDLDAVQAAMRAMVSGGAVQKYIIMGRQVEKMSVTDLRALESRLKYQVKKEQQKNGKGKDNPFNSYVRFNR